MKLKDLVTSSFARCYYLQFLVTVCTTEITFKKKSKKNLAVDQTCLLRALWVAAAGSVGDDFSLLLCRLYWSEPFVHSPQQVWAVITGTSPSSFTSQLNRFFLI